MLDTKAALEALEEPENSSGVGKTRVARELARAMCAAYVRIDSIEQALRTGSQAEGKRLFVAATPSHRSRAVYH